LAELIIWGDTAQKTFFNAFFVSDSRRFWRRLGRLPQARRYSNSFPEAQFHPLDALPARFLGVAGV
jgi:hypothetical protein